jgi:hypothetical protein
METVKNENPTPLFDEDLQGIFGNRYTDASAAPVKKAAPAAPVKKEREGKAVNKDGTVTPAKWEPPMPEPNWVDKLKAATKGAVLFGALCGLFFYWQQTGLMAPAAAMPSMLTCALMAGWHVGKTATK